jgi:hypothetical protein
MKQTAGLAGKWSRTKTTWIAASSFFAMFLIAISSANGADRVPDDSFTSDWMQIVSRTREIQPHWESLLGMSTPRLTQGFRYDYGQQYIPGGATFKNYGMGKGLDLIPGENFEIQIGIPAYIDKQGAKNSSFGWADEALLAKYRFLAANEENGNYIISGLLGLSVPTGSDSISSHSTIFTPSMAAGKGWGTRQHGIDIQSTLSASVPDHGQGNVGIPIVWNAALQGHILQNAWPEIEANYSHWYHGAHDGKSQLVLTYGIIFGRLEIKGREKISMGIGYQQPCGTNFSTFSRGWISMAKLSF